MHRISLAAVLMLPLTASLIPLRAGGQSAPAIPRPDSAHLDSIRPDSTRRQPRMLAPVRVRASRWRKPTPSEATAADATGGDRDSELLGIALDAQGSLAALGATAPGMTVVPGMEGSTLSTLGLPPAQTATTLNGVTFGAGDLPRGLFAPARVSSTPFDVSHGGFGGGQLAIRTFSGTVFTNGSVSTRLQSSLGGDLSAPRGGSLPVGVTVARSGPAMGERFFYNAALTVDRRASRFTTLQDGTDASATGTWISRDVASAAIEVLDSLGIPTRAPGSAAGVALTHGTAFARLDLAPTRLRTANLVSYASWNQMRPLALGPTVTMSHAGQRGGISAAILGEHTRLVRGRFMAHTRAAITSRNESTSAAVAGPEGRVLVPASSRGDSGLAAVTFGGAGAIASSTKASRLEVRHDLSWYSSSALHRWRITAQMSREGVSAVEPGNRSGRFFYNSLDDLRAGRAASFERELGGRSHTSQAWNLGLALGDLWRPKETLVVQYGLRLDADRLGGTATSDTLGTHTPLQLDVGSAFLSPRAGFAWSHGTVRSAGGFSRPRGTVRGGIGAFRGTHGPTDLRVPLIYNGLDGAIRRLECIGDAVPQADWGAWATGADAPSACNAGTDGSTVARNPDHVMLARGYMPATSWRASAGWAGDAAFGVRLSTDITGSRTHGLPGIRYTDVPPAPHFTIAGEDMRPVYVPAATIDPEFGVTSFGDALGATSGRSGELHSSLNARAVQVSTSLSPANFSPADRFLWSIGYAFTHAESKVSGFDASTAGDPRAVEWGPSPFSARHRVTGFAAMRLENGAFLAVSAQVQSGLPFTPIVGGDINGDGFVNDRAFITTDETRHSCLRAQVGRVARPGSCRGPMHASVDASVSLPGHLLRLPARSVVTFGLVNPLAGIDQLLHGRDVHGWGQQGTPDPVLIRPTGFDTTVRRFDYVRNPSFGDARRDMLTRWVPARIMVEVRLPLSPPRPEQLLQQVMAPGRERPGRRLTADEVKQRYMSFGILNPLHAVHDIRDSLQLTATQRARLDETIGAFNARLDTIWTPLARELAAIERIDDRPAVLASVRQAQNSAWDALEIAVAEVRSILTGYQLEQIDPAIAAMLDPGAVARLRRTEFRF